VSGLDEDRSCAAALASLRRMTPGRLAALVGHGPRAGWAYAAGLAAPPPGSLVARVLADDELRRLWASEARRVNPVIAGEACVAAGIAVSFTGCDDHPRAASDDPLPAPVLFRRGDPSLLEGRRVAVVGTRNATASGRAMARELGRGLASAGVHVVSGLARGIDGQAHGGALGALDAAACRVGEERGTPDDGVLGPAACGRPVAVVASGLDHVYPREHAALWERVAVDGLLLSEYPPGMPPMAHRFPLRNRLVAGLSEVVVVVESRERGGSLITAELAAERAVPVMAVPGSARSRAAAGANCLLRDGAAPVLDVADVLTALALDHRLVTPNGVDTRPAPRSADVPVLVACHAEPLTIGEVALRCGVDLLTAAMAVARLEQAGWLHHVDGWYEALGAPPRATGSEYRS